ncbi:SIS domain-containing protein [Thalassococcus profundi]|uniref:SIS domain-containing protein n=1 Tax=Thalassococcus profundi TaxID=2282382 RepID=A0A369TQ36_9RHOB|nr:SIS domain-containing protein [Thalassococcus profundi]RDD65076.1 SIS domain-containing protein [Thalassococcus profundi]
MSDPTHMRREILEIPAAVDTLLSKGAPAIKAAAAELAARDPAFLVSVARGSSDHAATYFKYATELCAGVPVASVGPSVASIYARPLKLSHSACLAVSQSGKSPDIVRMAQMAAEGGALSLALTNHADSDLAQVSAHTLELHAGAEQSVAATKTFVNSAVAAVWLLAEWQQDAELIAAIHALPRVLEEAAHQDWSALGAELGGHRSLYCLGRGPALAISNEAALKFKETCQLHAESYSSAEVLHGPVSIVDRGFPVIALCAADAAEASLASVADALADKGASVYATSAQVRGATALPTARTAHPLTDPISLIVSFYGMVEAVARARGIDPDSPRHLRKVTETV